MGSELAFSLASPRVSSALPIILQKPFAPLSLSSSLRVQTIQLFNGRQFCARRRVLLLPPKATADQQQDQVQQEEEVDDKILQYRSIDKKKKKSLGEATKELTCLIILNLNMTKLKIKG